MEETLPPRRVLAHLAWFSLFFLVFLAIGSGAFSFYLPSPTGSPGEKMAYYGRHRSDYDLLFLGDSRTYTNLQPDLVDPILDTRSLNLSAFAYWFPTQVPGFEKLAAMIPGKTTVVWSLGHQNFFPVFKTVNERYPIGILNVPRYLSWGFTPGQILPNLLYYNPAAGIMGHGAGVRKKIEDLRLFPLVPPRAAALPPPPTGEPASPSALLDAYRRDPAVVSAGLLEREGRVTSLEILKKRGSYLRVEVDRGYHRRKQREHSDKVRVHSGKIEPDEAYWSCFLAILDAFRKAGVNLVVNEFEEAPQQYQSRAEQERWRSFMRETVQPEVESRGFSYIRVDFDLFPPADYFDYNHLNSDGVSRFTPLFADLLAPHLSGR